MAAVLDVVVLGDVGFPACGEADLPQLGTKLLDGLALHIEEDGLHHLADAVAVHNANLGKHAKVQNYLQRDEHHRRFNLFFAPFAAFFA